MRKQLITILLGVLAMPSPLMASAHELVRIDIVDRDTGQWLQDHAHRGDRWIVGTPGHRYGVRLTNTSGERVLVVLSVDGVNAVTGDTAHTSQNGYVLAPWQSSEIVGWRKSHSEVAQFLFTALPDSYAARTGRPDNVGTIGVAVFRERQQSPMPRPHPRPPFAQQGHPRSANTEAAAPQSDAHAQQGQRQGIGTGHGEREWAPVGQTRFVRAHPGRPDQITQLRYDSPRALIAKGILPHRHGRHPALPRTPQAFPGNFVPDPPHRR